MKLRRQVKIVSGVPGSQGFEIEGLKISFRVDKTESSEANKSTVTIHNLNEYSRTQLNLDNAIIEIHAGYALDTGLELIFKGDINLVTTQFQRPDVITKVDAGDGEKALKEVKAVISYKEGASVATIIDDVFKKFNLPIKTKELLNPLRNTKFNAGKSFIGPAKKILDTLFAGVNMNWSIQNGEIKFYNAGSYDQSFAVELTSETGLIGSPIKTKISKSKAEKVKEVDGWRFVSLLEPKIEPGGIVTVSSREIEAGSQFKVVNVTHAGDSIEGEFTTVTEAILL